MKEQIEKMFASKPIVGSTGHHLLIDLEEVMAMRYRHQKAWLRSVKVEVAKERYRLEKKWRKENSKRRIDILRKIKEKFEAINKRIQQQITRFFQ